MASSAPEITAPRPAMNTGRFALSIASASRRTLVWIGMQRPRRRRQRERRRCCRSERASCTSVGRLSTTVCRSRSARVTARSVSSRAVAGVWMRSATAPTERAIAAWSKWKLFFTAPAGTSPASTSSGVRLLAASAMPVSALVRPGPGMHADQRQLLRRLGVGVRHAGRVALVPRRNDLDARLGQRMRDLEVGRAEQREAAARAVGGEVPRQHCRNRRSPAMPCPSPIRPACSAAMLPRPEIRSTAPAAAGS